MTSPIDPLRRAAKTRRTRRAGAHAAHEAGEAAGANLPVPIDTVAEPMAPEPVVDGHTVFTAQLLGQDGVRRGLRAGPSVIDTANASYNRAEWSGSKDRRARAGRTAKTEI